MYRRIHTITSTLLGWFAPAALGTDGRMSAWGPRVLILSAMPLGLHSDLCIEGWTLCWDAFY
jgi:hypothetical protein